jgi:hypothetical protein
MDNGEEDRSSSTMGTRKRYRVVSVEHGNEMRLASLPCCYWKKIRWSMDVPGSNTVQEEVQAGQQSPR